MELVTYEDARAFQEMLDRAGVNYDASNMIGSLKYQAEVVVGGLLVIASLRRLPDATVLINLWPISTMRKAVAA